MAFCIYLRKSRADLEAEARGEGETLSRHKKILLSYAKHRDLEIQRIYQEIVSGESLAARPAAQQLLSDVENRLWDGVLVMEIERLARGDTTDQGIVAEAFRCSGTHIITPLKDYDPLNEFDEEYFEFGLFMSRREYKTINRRLQQGRLQSVKEGKYLGSKPPYGYIRKKLPEKGYTLEPVAEQAKVVQMIFEAYAYGNQSTFSEGGLSVHEIVKKLNQMKVPSATGGLWTNSTINGILHNPVYIGKIRWNYRKAVKKKESGLITYSRPQSSEGLLTDGLHPPIITTELFQLVQSRRKRKVEKSVSGGKQLKNPLAGLIFCGYCGRKMIRRPYYASGASETLMCPNPNCKNVSAKLALVETRILSQLNEWLKSYQFPSSEVPMEQKQNTEEEIVRKQICSIKKRLIILEKQLLKTYDLLEQDIYNHETFQYRFHELNSEKDCLEKELVDAEKILQLTDSPSSQKKQIPPHIHTILDVYWETANAKLKNELLCTILEKVIYTKVVNGRWHNSQDDFELILYPRLSG